MKQYDGEDAVELRDGLGDSKKLPPVVANGRFVRGQEYIRTGEVAVNCRCSSVSSHRDSRPTFSHHIDLYSCLPRCWAPGSLLRVGAVGLPEGVWCGVGGGGWGGWVNDGGLLCAQVDASS